MKSLLLVSSLLLFASCGKEQFGTATQQSSDTLKSRESYDFSFQTNKTLLVPKVDILYVVDNSRSTYHMQDSLKTSVANTVQKISGSFDYRVISTPLISDSLTDYYVYTNSTDALPSTSNIVPTTNALLNPIFNNPQDGIEKGLARTISFMDHHETSGLLRKGAYHLVILVSNGRDEEVEITVNTAGKTELATVSENGQQVTLFSKRLTSFTQLKNRLESLQLRLFSVTASSVCQENWRSSVKSYQDMSRSLYALSGATDSSSQDVYDLCGSGFTSLFEGVNRSIQKQLVPHQYRYIPITFAENNQEVDIDAIRVTKISNGVATQLVKNTDWKYEYYSSPTSKPTREEPSVGEYVTGHHFIKLTQLLTYPDEIRVTSTSLIEYFQYVVIPKAAKDDGMIVVRVNGQEIPKSAISYEGFKANTNIKVVVNGSSSSPVLKTGYFIKITNPTYYFKSGDSVDVSYNPAPLN